MPSRATATATALSTHPGPTLAVTAVTALLGVGAALSPWRVALLALAMLAGQASVGLCNDWIDAGRDRAVGRRDKPVARGDVGVAPVRTAAFATLALALLLTAALGPAALGIHAVFLASAWAYNLGLKATPFSVAPYLLSFGLLPLLVAVSADPVRMTAWWPLAAGALLGAAAHFANVLPDLDDDRRTGVRGLPHRLGRRPTAIVAAAALALAAGVLLLGEASGGAAPSAIAATAVATALSGAVGVAGVALSGRATRWNFRLIILAALVDVVALVLTGRAWTFS
ncbi:UbiA family prenyltransferase [Galbitalea soli]|uniref:UbiA family prenyltransferase n=1 Tax=Galbitalea soli TaxID=1268042 RepID=A0A7C9PL41_9MICO|nr:UbiA family prenyltransferase [Galbitalea soli]NEM89809.1 UbiA family prenyltransferase [Galbitalea soli]NYJ30513.1 4-hydroxybenzoate polyprenyltransferase [Galbitalea soli]